MDGILNTISDLTFFGYSFTEAFTMFTFWSFVGWCIEVVYMTLETGEFQNRGFLNGPICPIYGFGVLIVTYFARPIDHTILLLFVVSMSICTAVELIVGVGMEKIFHNTWWDYSHERFNYKGYICLKVSLLWGLGCLLVIRVGHPTVVNLIERVPPFVLAIASVVIAVLLVPDMIVSVCAIENLNNRLRQLNEISDKLKASSVRIGEGLADETLELKAKYDRLVERKAVVQERLLKAFPYMKSSTYGSSLELVKESVRRKLSKKDK